MVSMPVLGWQLLLDKGRELMYHTSMSARQWYYVKLGLQYKGGLI